jgi:hypothetical protein
MRSNLCRQGLAWGMSLSVAAARKSETLRIRVLLMMTTLMMKAKTTAQGKSFFVRAARFLAWASQQAKDLLSGRPMATGP